MKQDENKIPYFHYRRKSTETEERQALSNESQGEENLKRFGHLKVIELPPESVSAFVPHKRPIFADMLARIEKGEAQGIIAWHPDRLSRNPIDAAQIIYLLDRGLLKDLKFSSSFFDNSPEGKMMLQITLSQSKYFSDKLSNDVTRGLKKKARMGWLPGVAPPGYLNEPWKPAGTRTIQRDEKTFPLLRKAIDLLLSGAHTASEVYQIAANEWGVRTRTGKPLSRTSFYRLLGNPFICGLFEYSKGSGNWYRGAHPRLTTEDEFDQLQVILGRKGRPRGKHHIFSFTGTMQCGECGAAITAAKKVKRQKNGNIHRYTYYFCTKRKNPKCSQKCIEEKALTAQIIELLDRLSAPPQFYEYARKWFRGDYDTEAELQKKILARHQAAYKECLEKLDKLIDMRAAEEISEEEFARKRGKLLKEKVRFQGLLEETDNQANGWVDVARDMVTFIERAKERLRNGTPEQRREILVALGWNRTLTNQKLAIQLQKPLIPMEKVVFAFWRIFLGLEPRQKRMTQRQFEELCNRSPVLLRGRDEVRTSIRSLSGCSPFRIVASW